MPLTRKRKQLEGLADAITLSVKWIELLSCEWFLSTLFEYVDVRDVVYMDTAMCNKTYRPKWLECISQDFGDLSNRIQAYFRNVDCIQWCANNNIMFKKMHLNE